MATVNRRRSDINKLIQASRQEAARRNRKIDTIDLILITGKRLYPLLPWEELYDYCSTALRVILSEPYTETHQTTLLAHV